MSEAIFHLQHLFHFDGLLHWCALIAIFTFIIGTIWVFLRILLPLRQLVKEATSLADGELPAFDTLDRGVAEIQQLRLALRQMVTRIREAQTLASEYRMALTDSQEQERLRLSREIHDDTIQSLIVTAHHIERAMQTTTASPNAMIEYLRNARTQIVETINNLRQMIGNLRPTVLDELGLFAALEALREAHPRIELRIAGTVRKIEDVHELAIFRAAQEAINNAERHARASRITVSLHFSPSTVTLEICDDGVGFDIPRQFQEFALRGHYGLIGIRERIVHLGGHLNLTSTPSSGTRLAVVLPLAMG
jgi:signal transduction histidine kinase